PLLTVQTSSALATLATTRATIAISASPRSNGENERRRLSPAVMATTSGCSADAADGPAERERSTREDRGRGIRGPNGRRRYYRPAARTRGKSHAGSSRHGDRSSGPRPCDDARRRARCYRPRLDAARRPRLECSPASPSGRVLEVPMPIPARHTLAVLGA